MKAFETAASPLALKGAQTYHPKVSIVTSSGRKRFDIHASFEFVETNFPSLYASPTGVLNRRNAPLALAPSTSDDPSAYKWTRTSVGYVISLPVLFTGAKRTVGLRKLTEVTIYKIGDSWAFGTVDVTTFERRTKKKVKNPHVKTSKPIVAPKSTKTNGIWSRSNIQKTQKTEKGDPTATKQSNNSAAPDNAATQVMDMLKEAVTTVNRLAPIVGAVMKTNGKRLSVHIDIID